MTTSPEETMPTRAGVALSRRALGAVVVVTVTAQIDLASWRLLDERLGQLLAAANFSRMVIDVSGIRFFGIRAARCLLRAQKTANKRGIQLRVVPGPGLATSVLKICDRHNLIALEPSVDTACDLNTPPTEVTAQTA